MNVFSCFFICMLQEAKRRTRKLEKFKNLFRYEKYFCKIYEINSVESFIEFS